MNMLNPVDYRRRQTQSDDNIIMNDLIKEMCSLNNRSITYKTQQAILGIRLKRNFIGNFDLIIETNGTVWHFLFKVWYGTRK